MVFPVAVSAFEIIPRQNRDNGTGLDGLSPIGMLLVPFYDRSIPTDRRGKIATLFGIIVLAGMIIFTVWGYLS